MGKIKGWGERKDVAAIAFAPYPTIALDAVEEGEDPFAGKACGGLGFGDGEALTHKSSGKELVDELVVGLAREEEAGIEAYGKVCATEEGKVLPIAGRSPLRSLIARG